MSQSDKPPVPLPATMPVDRERWAQELHLSNFINTYYQFRDLRSCGEVKTVLVIGPGQGLDTLVLRWKGYTVTTFDIDETFKPDVIGSVHDLSCFEDARFDAVIASHVLEHLAVPYLDRCLGELSRVGRYCLIYLPVAGRHASLRLQADVKGLDLALLFDLFNVFHKPDGVTPRYCARQHFWEIGMRGFRVRDLRRRLLRHFTILASYRNRDWYSSYNFVLKSRHAE